MPAHDILLAWLDSKIHLNLEKYQYILEMYSSLEAGIEDNFNLILAQKWATKFQKPADLKSDLNQFQDLLFKHNVELVTFLSPQYPQKLSILEESLPLVFYYQGNLGALQSNQMLTVVGSRDITNYAKMVMQNILKPACRLGVGVVSGLALGVDGFSHQMALESGAVTIAVVGSGLDNTNFYPSQNLALKKQIIDSRGLILSEYCPGSRATTFNFPLRNRILAALTEVTWIVQASLKSGTLITASLARELGKTVATIPASVLERQYAGNLQLLKDGANIISQTEDILQLLGLSNFRPVAVNPVVELKFESLLEKQIYEKLTLVPVDIDQLAPILEIPVNEIIPVLTLLELRGIAINLGLNQWVKTA